MALGDLPAVPPACFLVVQLHCFCSPGWPRTHDPAAYAFQCWDSRAVVHTWVGWFVCFLLLFLIFPGAGGFLVLFTAGICIKTTLSSNKRPDNAHRAPSANMTDLPVGTPAVFPGSLCEMGVLVADTSGFPRLLLAFPSSLLGEGHSGVETLT